MYCTKCGKEISDDAKFCTHCGARAASQSQETENQKNMVDEIPTEGTGDGGQTEKSWLSDLWSGIQEKAVELWKRQDLFGKAMLSALAVVLLFGLAAFLSGVILSGVAALIQAGLIVWAWMIQKKMIRVKDARILYGLLAGVVLLSILYFVLLSPPRAERKPEPPEIEQPFQDILADWTEPSMQPEKPLVQAELPEGTACEFQLEVECVPNLMFSTYDLTVYLDDQPVGQLKHGDKDVLLLQSTVGDHEVKFLKSDDRNVRGMCSIDLTENTHASYRLICYSDRVDMTQRYCETFAPLKAGQLRAPDYAEKYLGRGQEDVAGELARAGFSDIQKTELRDLTPDQQDQSGLVTEISIDGKSDFYKADVFDSQAPVQILYHTQEPSWEEMQGKLQGQAGKPAAEVIVSFDGTGYTLKYCVDGREVSDVTQDDCLFVDGTISMEEKTARLQFLTQEKWQLLTELEKTFPKEYAKRAVVVAMTNGQDPAVLSEDGNTYAPWKFHAYSDVKGFFMLPVEEGQWYPVDDSTWHGKGLLLRIFDTDTYVRVSCDVRQDGQQYVLSSVQQAMGHRENLAGEDSMQVNTNSLEPSAATPFLTVPQNLITTDRDENAMAQRQQEAADRAKAEREYQAWVEAQFSAWDGKHTALCRMIKDNLNDRSSFQHRETRYVEITDETVRQEMTSILQQMGVYRQLELGDLVILVEYSAKNAFNATITKTAVGLAQYAGDSLELLIM